MFSVAVTVQMVEKIILVWKQLEHALFRDRAEKGPMKNSSCGGKRKNPD